MFFSPTVVKTADAIVAAMEASHQTPFLGVHLRIEGDWKNFGPSDARETVSPLTEVPPGAPGRMACLLGRMCIGQEPRDFQSGERQVLGFSRAPHGLSTSFFNNPSCSTGCCL
jgi:hypothetical protein